MARVTRITQFYLPLTRLSTKGDVVKLWFYNCRGTNALTIISLIHRLIFANAIFDFSFVCSK